MELLRPGPRPRGEVQEELGKGNVRQAVERFWGAAAFAIKAYAYWRESKHLTSHR